MALVLEALGVWGFGLSAKSLGSTWVRTHGSHLPKAAALDHTDLLRSRFFLHGAHSQQ